MKYDYTKTINSEKLKLEILAAGLSVDYINTVGPDVQIFMTTELSTLEKDTLDSIVIAHEAISIKDIIKKKVLKSIELGQEVIAEFAAENKLMGLTDQEMLQTSDLLKDVQRLLGSGSLALAKDAIMLLTPVDIILDQTRINKYADLIQQKINEL